MKKTFLAGIAVLAIASTTASAFYTECTVTKEMHLANRPNGSSDPRFGIINKGDKVAFRDKHKDWWFVIHYNGNTPEYGWVPRNVLTNCQVQEGTP